MSQWGWGDRYERVVVLGRDIMEQDDAVGLAHRVVLRKYCINRTVGVVYRQY